MSSPVAHSTPLDGRPHAGCGAQPAADVQADPAWSGCCPHLHEAVELIGRRWTGAILAVLLDGGTMRFSEICQAVPQLSDRLLSERMKELEARGIVERRVLAPAPVRVQYTITEMGRELAPTLDELQRWAHRWLR